MDSQIYKPGERAPQTGIYEVQHYQHRFAYEATILAREIFPFCRLCGRRVSFRLVRPAERLKSDFDFKKQGQTLRSKSA